SQRQGFGGQPAIGDLQSGFPSGKGAEIGHPASPVAVLGNLPSAATLVDAQPQRRSGMIEIPARKGKAARVRQGQTVKAINTKGQQVVDTWAFSADDMREFMSMEHSRVAMGRIIPAIGDALVTNKRRPILTMVE